MESAKVHIRELFDNESFWKELEKTPAQAIPINSDQFNEKWKSHIEIGFEDQGLMFDGPFHLIVWLDYVFTFIQSKYHWVYSQVKWKFGFSRFYATGLPRHISDYIESGLNYIVHSQEGKIVKNPLVIDQSKWDSLYRRVVNEQEEGKKLREEYYSKLTK